MGMTHTTYGPDWCCTDCIMLLANGETPPEMTEAETDEWLADINRRAEGGHWTLGMSWEDHSDDCDARETGWDCECETQEFSWASCAVCGSHLGGSRHAVTFFDNPIDTNKVGV